MTSEEAGKAPLPEPPDMRRKRARMRSWRRGTREMDLLLGPFADRALAHLSDEVLTDFENLLSENDHDLYRWISSGSGHPARYSEIVRRIAAYHRIV